jgi:hypothetical protein
VLVVGNLARELHVAAVAMDWLPSTRLPVMAQCRVAEEQLIAVVAREWRHAMAADHMVLFECHRVVERPLAGLADALLRRGLPVTGHMLQKSVSRSEVVAAHVAIQARSRLGSRHGRNDSYAVVEGGRRCGWFRARFRGWGKQV